MTPRTLWTILLKTIGIYFFFEWLSFIRELLIISVSLFSESRDLAIHDLATNGILPVAYILFIGIYSLILFGLIFRTDWVIDKLHLNKGIPEEKLEINIHRSSVLRIIIVITGALILVDSLPLLLKQLMGYLQQINLYPSFKQSPYADWIIYHLVKVFFGFFMLTSSRLIVNFIERKRKGKVQVKSIED